MSSLKMSKNNLFRFQLDFQNTLSEHPGFRKSPTAQFIGPSPVQEATAVREEIRTSHVERCGYLRVPPAKTNKTHHGKKDMLHFFSPANFLPAPHEPGGLRWTIFWLQNLDQLIDFFTLKPASILLELFPFWICLLCLCRISYSPSNARVLGQHCDLVMPGISVSSFKNDREWRLYIYKTSPNISEGKIYLRVPTTAS